MTPDEIRSQLGAAQLEEFQKIINCGGANSDAAVAFSIALLADLVRELTAQMAEIKDLLNLTYRNRR